MTETAFQAQRRKLRELKDKQDGGEASHPASRISGKAQKRRDAETAAKPAKKKVSKKKTSSSTTE